MFCKNCGKELSDDAMFCTGCGAKTNVNVNKNDDISNKESTAAKNKKKLFVIIPIIISVMIIGSIIIKVLLLDDYFTISGIKNGYPYAYPNKTWGDTLEETCRDSKWKTYTNGSNDTIVEYNGIVKQTNEKLRILFNSSDDKEYVIDYMYVDGMSCSDEEIDAVISALFE